MSTMEYVGDLKFQSDNIKPQNSHEDWIARGEEQAAFARFTLAILNMTDKQLERYARNLGATHEETCERAVDLVEWCQAWQASYEAGAEVAESACLRMIVVCERLYGREAIEEAYRED